MERKTVLIVITTMLCLIIVGLSFCLYRRQASFQILSKNYASLQQDYAALEDKHASLRSEYNSLRSEHDTLFSEYNSLSKDHDSLQTEYRKLSEEHDILVKDYEIIYSSRYEEGYDDGYIQGIADGAGRGYNIRDPSYKEALQFISSDQTDENRYAEEEYTCVNFAADFKNNAFEAEYRCGFVYIEFLESAHAIVCFNTTDRGLIYIEPQDDELVTLNIGQPYFDRTKYQVIFDDTVIRFMIVW